MDARTAITGRRDAAQVTTAAETDDHSRRWNKPDELWVCYGAAFVGTGFDHRGNLTLRSAADIMAGNAPGVTIGQNRSLSPVTLTTRGTTLSAKVVGNVAAVANDSDTCLAGNLSVKHVVEASNGTA